MNYSQQSNTISYAVYFKFFVRNWNAVFFLIISRFKGIREGGVSENAAYYVFTHAADGAIDAYPLQEW